MSVRGKLIKNWNGPLDMSVEEAKGVMSRLRSSQQDKFRDARYVRYEAPNTVHFIYEKKPTETGTLHLERKR